MPNEVVKTLCKLVEDLSEGRETYVHEYVDATLAAVDLIEDLEAKLAKLERAAKPFAAIKIKDGMSQPGEIGRTDVTNIRAALAELKGGKDE